MKTLWICLSFLAGLVAATWCADLAVGQEAGKTFAKSQQNVNRGALSHDSRMASVNNIRLRHQSENEQPDDRTPAQAAEDQKNLPPIVARSIKHDALSKMRAPRFQQGWNLVEKLPSGWAIYVYVQPNRDPLYRIVDKNGRPAKMYKARSKTTCWECGKDDQGNVHCWKVPCPKIVGPWKLKASALKAHR